MDVAFRSGHDFRGTNVESNDGSDDAKVSTNFANGSLAKELSKGQAKESNIQSTEEGDEGNAFTESAKEHDEGENEPGQQVDAQSACKFGGVGVGSKNTRGRDENRGV